MNRRITRGFYEKTPILIKYGDFNGNIKTTEHSLMAIIYQG